MHTSTLSWPRGVSFALIADIPARYPDESLSSRAHRMRTKGQRYWGWTANAIDLLFFWQRNPGHCERAYLNECRNPVAARWEA